MLNSTQSVVMIAINIALSMAFLAVLRRLWPTASRRQHNDLIGWQITVLGTTYAVIIGFMLFAVWTNFQVAEDNAAAEANSLVNVARLADGLPAERRANIQHLAAKYADLMVQEEWPDMQHENLSAAAHEVTRQLWAEVGQTEVQTALQQISLDHTISELTEMTEHRRVRQLESRSKLPEVLWSVLIVGAVITIMYSCLFGTENFTLHIVQVCTLTLMLSLVLVAIAEINRPFQGSVHIRSDAFEQAQVTLRGMAARH